MIQFLEHFLGAFAALFPIVNPFSTMPLFLSLTSGMSAPEQRYQALKASIIAAVIMLVVLYIGAVILHFFGISIGALRVAGGLIVAYIGFRILFPSRPRTALVLSDSCSFLSAGERLLLHPDGFSLSLGRGDHATALGRTLG